MSSVLVTFSEKAPGSGRFTEPVLELPFCSSFTLDIRLSLQHGSFEVMHILLYVCPLRTVRNKTLSGQDVVPLAKAIYLGKSLQTSSACRYLSPVATLIFPSVDHDNPTNSTITKILAAILKVQKAAQQQLFRTFCSGMRPG